VDDMNISVTLVPTAILAGKPKLIRNGVRIKPPPKPKKPDRIPIKKPITTKQRIVLKFNIKSSLHKRDFNTFN